MDSRLLLKGKDLKILIDSNSIDQLFSNPQSKLKELLAYNSCKEFQFLRSPLETNHQILNEIPHYEKIDENGRSSIIRYEGEFGTHETLFSYSQEDIKEIAKEEVFKKDSINSEELERIMIVFVKSCLESSFDLLLTNDNIILNSRRWFESHFPGVQVNICTVEETMEIMDLFTKMLGEYYISNFWRANKGLWYWTSFRNKIPFYNVSSPILQAFSSRFVFLLQSIDEIGTQFYMGSNNDTSDNTIYHFNYFIVLTTGIFDSLAIETKDKLEIQFEGDNIPSKISLSNNIGRDFLREIRNQNSDLRNHINDYVDFINLIYSLREVVLHREGLSAIGYVYRDVDDSWQYNFVKISKDIADLIKRNGDSANNFDPISKWGVYQDAVGYVLSPFQFTKQAGKKLIEFSNRYLELLEFSNFFDSLNPSNDFFKRNKRFGIEKLGF